MLRVIAAALCALVVGAGPSLAEPWAYVHRGEGPAAAVKNGWGLLGFVCMPAGVHGEYMVERDAVDETMSRLRLVDLTINVDGAVAHTAGYYSNYGNRIA